MLADIGLPAIWEYLYNVLWSWAGLLLAIDAVVALTERYLGEWLESRFHRNIGLPTRAKLAFAVVVFIIAQAIAYRDLQKEMMQAQKNNQLLQLSLSKITQERDDLKNTKSTGEDATSQAVLSTQSRTIDDLTSKLATSTQQANSCQSKLTESLKPRCWFGVGHAIYHPQWSGPPGPMPPGQTLDDQDFATETAAFCNHNISAPWQAIVEFDKPILNGQVQNDGGKVQLGGAMATNSRLLKTQFLSIVQTPPMSAYIPIYITVHTKGPTHAIRGLIMPQP